LIQGVIGAKCSFWLWLCMGMWYSWLGFFPKK
jgi:hypothetical protein